MAEENNKIRNRLTLITVLIVFIAPLVISWWYLNYSDVVETGKKSNHGDLYVPARPLPNIDLVDPLEPQRHGKLHGKWSFVYITHELCDQACEENLYRMRQVRLTAGKDDHRVQRVLLVSGENKHIDKKIFINYAGQWIADTANISLTELIKNFRITTDDIPQKMQRLYLVDPLGNLMMSYPVDAEPRGIIKDLKKLLKTSKIG